MRSDSPGGLTTDPSGPAPVPVSPSAPPESEPAQMTLGICGPHGSGSSASADLSQRLANRLRARLPTAGSTEYRQTWKQKATPSGRSYWGAHSVGAPHIRQRLWWVADRVGVSDRPGRRSGIVATEAARHGDPAESTSRADGLADAERAERRAVDHARGNARGHGLPPGEESAGRTRSGGEDGRLGDAAPHGRVEERADARRGRERSAPEGGEQRPWDDSELIPCADGRARRIPQSGIFPLADGVPGRVGRLRAYGNAICPQVAAVFIRAYRDVRHHT